MTEYRADTFTVNLGAEAIDTSTGYILVDLSDTTNFPHTKTNSLNLLGLHMDAEKKSDGVFDFWIGVIYEVDATNGSVQWLDVLHFEHIAANATETTDRMVVSRDYTLGGAVPHGINCQVNSLGTGLTGFVGNQKQADSTTWQTDVDMVNPANTTNHSGAGDLVLWVEEVTNGGSVDFSFTVTYEAL